MQTEELIAQLSSGLTPVRRLPGPWILAVRWLVVAIAVIALATAAFGLRRDLAARLADSSDLRQMIAAGLAGVLAAISALQLSFPDRSANWGLLPIPATGFWVGDLGWGCLRDLIESGFDRMNLETSVPCLAFILGFGLPLSLAMALLVRRAAPVRSLPVALLGGLAAASLTNVGMMMMHPVDAAATVLAWHGLGVLITVGGSALLGPRVMGSP
ncbi:DUF1109 domain-containing protein [Roseomonas hellenica]|uniref:DUF1109 domain-containing protein n=1 Tax=Plastoroseomonas hellenica TaxID=2687306 RepID=A0ABS5EWK7_9PROT|nr:NrsF family protein [Plastoroseomonas hellenica]MBR0664679.1 DUF1109 domain-containing protein [Plastoroseomonas hellenica]